MPVTIRAWRAPKSFHHCCKCRLICYRLLMKELMLLVEEIHMNTGVILELVRVEQRSPVLHSSTHYTDYYIAIHFVHLNIVRCDYEILSQVFEELFNSIPSFPA